MASDVRADVRTLLCCFPIGVVDAVTHTAWHDVVCPSVACIAHRWSFATQVAAHNVLTSDFRGLLMRTTYLRAQCAYG